MIPVGCSSSVTITSSPAFQSMPYATVLSPSDTDLSSAISSAVTPKWLATVPRAPLELLADRPLDRRGVRPTLHRGPVLAGDVVDHLPRQRDQCRPCFM